jgi:hypothetical protein
MDSIPLILKINLASLYIDKEFVREIFTSLNLGDISDIKYEIVSIKTRGSKGNKLYDTKQTYYKNIYISFSKIYEDKAIIKKMFEQFSKDSHLVVHYSDDLYWRVYKSDTLPTFKPMISFPIKN